jgi:hypothetical protein
MTQSYNLRTFYEEKLQFTHFVWLKVTIYAHYITESYILRTLYDTKLQFTHFLLRKVAIYALCMTETYKLSPLYYTKLQFDAQFVNNKLWCFLNPFKLK